MRKLAGAVLALALALTPGLALSLERTGVIQEVEPSDSTLTLRDGQEFSLAQGLAVDELKPGTEVTVVYVVVYKAADREMVALQVQPKTEETPQSD